MYLNYVVPVGQYNEVAQTRSNWNIFGANILTYFLDRRYYIFNEITIRPTWNKYPEG